MARMDLQAPSRTALDRTLVDALRRRLADDTGQPVPLVETHISWVLLTDRLAYKLKKPVRLSFVDFSTLKDSMSALPALLTTNCA